MNPSPPIIGIDLGTTYSSAAHIHKGRPEIIPSPDGTGIIPSVVHINQEEKVMVGRDARAALVAMPGRTIAAIKRKMGSDQKEKLAGKEFLPQEISALILKELKGYADNLLGPGEKEAVITVPAYFTDDQRRATKQAGELAGFFVERIINEPTAAAMAFGLYNLQEDRNILVYDLGGGTFDVSVLETMDGILEVRASSGNSLLGGEDFDWLLVDWMADIIKKHHGADPRQDLKGKALLKEEAERVKISLTEKEEETASLPVVMFKNDKPIGFTEKISRSRFEEMIDPLLQETRDKVLEVLEDAGLEVEDIDDILLVGGSTRIPRVRELLFETFRKEPRKDVHPDEAVALGAAVQAGIKSGAVDRSEMIVTDVAPFSMGIAVLKHQAGQLPKPGGFCAIIPRNTTIPVTRKQNFYTSSDGQPAVSIEVYQGEHEWVEHNKALGEFVLNGVPPAPAGKEVIEVQLHYNLNGILEVSAKCLSNGESMQVVVQDALSRFDREAFKESAASLEALWKNAAPHGEDRDSRSQSMKRTQQDLEDYLEGEGPFDAAANLEELERETRLLMRRAQKIRPKISGAKKKKLAGAIQLLQDALRKKDPRVLEEAIDEAADILIDLDL